MSIRVKATSVRPPVGVPALVPAGAAASAPPFYLDRPITLVGCRNRAHVRLESDDVSRSHAVVVNTGGRVVIRDLASRTHVFVNGRQVEEAELADGDHVTIGRFTLRFDAGGQTPRPRAIRPDDIAATLTGDGIGPGGVALTGCLCVIGSRHGVDLELRSSQVSFAHAIIVLEDGRHILRDLGSRSGTFLDGVAVEGDAELRAGGALRIGPYNLRYDVWQPAREDAERQEAERPEAERLDAERVEDERLEAERLAVAQAEAARAEAARREAERQQAERLEAERREAERLEAHRREAERREVERRDAERREAERQQREAARTEAEEREAEKREAEKREAERIEAERRLRQRQQAERREAHRVESERREAERHEAERLEAVRREAERVAAEVENQRREAECRRELREAEQREVERREAERREMQRVESERREAERRETERLAAERRQAERLESERREAERQRKLREAERLDAERREAQRREAEAAERREAQRVEAARREAERLEAARAAAEKVEAERIEAEKREAERQSSHDEAGPLPVQTREPASDFDVSFEFVPPIESATAILEPSLLELHDSSAVIPPSTPFQTGPTLPATALKPIERPAPADAPETFDTPARDRGAAEPLEAESGSDLGREPTSPIAPHPTPGARTADEATGFWLARAASRAEPALPPARWGVLATAIAIAEAPHHDAHPTAAAPTLPPARRRSSRLKWLTAAVAVLAVGASVVVATGAHTALLRFLH